MTTPTTTPQTPPPAEPLIDPFTVLGLPPDSDLTDHQVHDAWQRQLGSANAGTDDDGRITRAFEGLRSAVRRAEDLVTYWDTRSGETSSESPPDLEASDAASDTYARARMPRPRQPEERIDGLVPSPERREELRRIVAEQRREQGLPPVIEDEAIIAKLVDILLHSHDFPEDRQRGAAGSADEIVRTDPGMQRSQAGRDPGREHQSRLANMLFRIRSGRPAWLIGRILVAFAVPVSAYVAEPGYPAWIALAVGTLTWLGFTARYDLAPEPVDRTRR